MCYILGKLLGMKWTCYQYLLFTVWLGRQMKNKKKNKYNHKFWSLLHKGKNRGNTPELFVLFYVLFCFFVETSLSLPLYHFQFSLSSYFLLYWFHILISFTETSKTFLHSISTSIGSFIIELWLRRVSKPEEKHILPSSKRRLR